MCNYQTWFYDDKIGYVVECKKCQKIQIGFGNIMVTFTHKDFDYFRKYLSSVIEERRPSEDKKLKSILLRTPANGICFLLSEIELHNLQQMIDDADTEMKTLNMLKLFNAKK